MEILEIALSLKLLTFLFSQLEMGGLRSFMAGVFLFGLFGVFMVGALSFSYRVFNYPSRGKKNE